MKANAFVCTFAVFPSAQKHKQKTAKELPRQRITTRQCTDKQ